MSWSDYHVQECIVQLHTLRDSLIHRILPTFSSVEQEGAVLVEEALDQLKAQSGADEDPDYDSSGDAEKAEARKYDYYALMAGLRQSLINSTAASMHHLFEQQLREFLRREISLGRPTVLSNTFRKEFAAEVAKAGHDISGWPSWADADILRLTSNTIKHADGTSADDLRKRRAELFAPPGAAITQSNEGAFRESLRYPALGDLFVTPEDIEQWTRSLTDFWTRIGEAFVKPQAPLEF